MGTLPPHLALKVSSGSGEKIIKPLCIVFPQFAISTKTGLLNMLILGIRHLGFRETLQPQFLRPRAMSCRKKHYSITMG